MADTPTGYSGPIPISIASTAWIASVGSAYGAAPDPIVPVSPYADALPRSRDAGGSWDGRRRGWQVRAYRLVDGAWRRLLNELPTRRVVEVRFVNRMDGGMSQLDLSFPLPLGTECALLPNDRISVWVREASGWLEWWRGYYQSGRHSSRPDTFELTAYGAVERLKGVSVNRQYAFSEQDLSALFSALVLDYAFPWYEELGIPAPSLDIQTVGITVGETKLLQGSLSEVLSGLVKGVPGVTWGVDLDGYGLERIYLRPRPQHAAYHAFYRKDCVSLGFETDASEVVNALTIEAGPALYPNLVTNGGFELPSNEGANVVLNPSFEDVQTDDDKTALHWDRVSGDPAAKSNEGRSGNDTLSAASGSRYMELDNNAGVEEIRGDPVSVTGGVRYRFRVNMAAQSAAHACTPEIWLRVWDGSATELSAVPISGPSGYPNAWTVSQQVWSLKEYAFDMPAAAATVSVCIRLPAVDSGSSAGMGIDDVRLFSADSMTQTGWLLNANDTTEGLSSSVAAMDAAARDAAQGAYCIRLRYSTGNDAYCYAGIQTGPNAIAIGANAECRLSFWARSGSETEAQNLDALLFEYDGSKWRRRASIAGDGSAVNDGRRISLPAGGGWRRYHVDYRTSSDCRQAALLFGGLGASASGTAYLDGVYLHVGWPVDASGDPVLYPFVEGSAMVTYRLTTEDAWFQSDADPIGRYASQAARDSAVWHSGELAGQPHFGTREARVSESKVRSAADAERYFVNYANQRAAPASPSPARIVDRIRNIRPDGLLHVSNVPGGRSGLTLMPVQVTHTFGRAGWSCEVERSEERADLTALISQIGQSVDAAHATLSTAVEAAALSASTTGVTAGMATSAASVVWLEGNAAEGAETIALNVAGRPVAASAIDDVQVWVGGKKWRQPYVDVAADGSMITVSALPGVPFTAADAYEARYETLIAGI
ncbi:MAG TPA: hypothetical protein VGM37_10420 [Armatimonadota bacterium]|jgi:hypothetical protein